jgi:hypothetical protein
VEDLENESLSATATLSVAQANHLALDDLTTQYKKPRTARMKSGEQSIRQRDQKVLPRFEAASGSNWFRGGRDSLLEQCSNQTGVGVPLTANLPQQLQRELEHVQQQN